MADRAKTHRFWRQALVDVVSGKRTDFVPLQANIPPFSTWLTPLRAQFYMERDAAVVCQVSASEENYGETECRIPNPLDPRSDRKLYTRLRDLAAAAGVEYSDNPPQADYLKTYYRIPSYQGTGNFFEKVMQKAPVIAAAAFGAAAAAGALAPYTVAETAAIGGEVVAAGGGFITDAELAQAAALDVTGSVTAPAIETFTPAAAQAGNVASVPPVTPSPVAVPPPSGIALPSAGTLAKQALPVAMKLFSPNAAPSGAASSLTGQYPQVNYQDAYDLTGSRNNRILLIGGGLLAVLVAAFALRRK